jgi:hypothetical protein
MLARGVIANADVLFVHSALGSATIAHIRTGTGSKWALLYVLPPLLSALALAGLLLWKLRHQVPLSSAKLTQLADFFGGS